jgi:O-antigen/teichoic acid export membrane protein
MAGTARILATAVIALLLPAYLTKHLDVRTYGAWTLIVQLSAYVSFLDFGVQTAVSASVAEFDARCDAVGAGRRASAGLLVLVTGSIIGVALTSLLAWQVPQVFTHMPALLYPQVRVSVIVLGLSLSYTLLSSAFSSVFIGLQRFPVPVALTIANRFLAATVIFLVVLHHGALSAMAVGVAVVNITTSSLQIVLCRKLVPHVVVALLPIHPSIAREVLKSCFVIAMISGAMLCINGLDLIVVGRYDFARTAYYSVAASPNALMLMLLSAAMGAFLPATSALKARKTAHDMRTLLLRVTRYSSVLVILMGIGLLTFGPWLLKIWVGPRYASNAMPILRILVVANVIRNLYAPYATMIVALGKQAVLLASSFLEAAVNLTSSVYFAIHFGAIGVAWGTLLGATAGVALHFSLTMGRSKEELPVSRREMLVWTILRPAIVISPFASLMILRRAFPRQCSQVWIEGLCLLVCFGLGLFFALGVNERERLGEAILGWWSAIV